MRHAALFFIIALTGAVLDLLTKHLAFQYIPRGGEVPVIDGFFSLGHTTNPGIIFGKFPAGRTLWLVVSIAAVPAILAIFFSIRPPRWILTVTLGMILAGTLGNMYDRVFTAEHAVRDFIKFYYRTSSGAERVWPLFNLADSYICVGVFLLSIEMFFFDEKKSKTRASPPTPAPAPSPGPDPAAP